MVKPKAGESIELAMCISPYEAEELFQQISKSTKVFLYSYQPRWNIAYDPLDKLDFFQVPLQIPAPTLSPSLLATLNLFAGQLYFSSHQEYKATCDLLGLSTEENTSESVLIGVELLLEILDWSSPP